jgi:hypothetical protein
MFRQHPGCYKVVFLSVAYLFSFLSCDVCFIFACLQSGYFLPNVDSVSALSIFDYPFLFFERLIVLYLIGFSMGTLSIDGYNTEYRGFLPTNDTSKLELIFC